MVERKKGGSEKMFRSKCFCCSCEKEEKEEGIHVFFLIKILSDVEV